MRLVRTSDNEVPFVSSLEATYLLQIDVGQNCFVPFKAGSTRTQTKPLSEFTGSSVESRALTFVNFYCLFVCLFSQYHIGSNMVFHCYLACSNVLILFFVLCIIFTGKFLVLRKNGVPEFGNLRKCHDMSTYTSVQFLMATFARKTHHGL